MGGSSDDGRGDSSYGRSMRTSTLAAGAAAALALVLAPAAHAGPITFERGGDVWLVEADGGGLRQVTSGGGYRSPRSPTTARSSPRATPDWCG